MKRASFIISLIVCIGGIATLAHMNYTLTPDYLWFIYPGFGLIWYPVTMYYIINRNFKQYAIAGCLLINAFFNDDQLYACTRSSMVHVSINALYFGGR